MKCYNKIGFNKLACDDCEFWEDNVSRATEYEALSGVQFSDNYERKADGRGAIFKTAVS